MTTIDTLTQGEPAPGDEICVCGHGAGHHGRRGFGSCRHGWISPTVRLLSDDAPPRCECKRFKKPKAQRKDPR